MKKNYALYEKLANHNPKQKLMVGVHGSVSEYEMFVPLITIDC